MTRSGLHIASLCALLLLLQAGRTAARRTPCAPQLSGPAARDPPGPRPRCVTEAQLRSREDRFLKKYAATELSTQSSNRTCAQVLEEMRKEPQRFKEKSRRSLSPWEYSVHRDADRVPAEISMARCLCDGCIINLREVSSYNSVLVCAQTTVLRRKPCPSDPNKFVVWKELMAVPVGCTCVRPNYSQ
ncbi:interleukin-17C-like [Xiphophorus couchianus]|uniref:interleukin-17C-like n=1 Tax=Xiphophorus couchianus TaxID=32473 RepID=UPI001016AE93|nr:interleukin-17C-like [Xiphophorus couchianus]